MQVEFPETLACKLTLSNDDDKVEGWPALIMKMFETKYECFTNCYNTLKSIKAVASMLEKRRSRGRPSVTVIEYLRHASKKIVQEELPDTTSQAPAGKKLSFNKGVGYMRAAERISETYRVAFDFNTKFYKGVGYQLYNDHQGSFKEEIEKYLKTEREIPTYWNMICGVRRAIKCSIDNIIDEIVLVRYKDDKGNVVEDKYKLGFKEYTQTELDTLKDKVDETMKQYRACEVEEDQRVKSNPNQTKAKNLLKKRPSSGALVSSKAFMMKRPRVDITQTTVTA